jgi:uncharacterized damage-inducible protein DinB
MTYYGGKHLANSFRTVRQNTVKIAEDIPEDNYSFKASPDTKSIGQLLVHIALGHRFQHQAHAVDRLSTLEGFNFPAFMQKVGAEEQQPRTKAQIIDLLTTEGEAFASWLEGLPEEFLREEVKAPVAAQAARTRFEMLLSAKEHEMHHRGQLMLMQRMIGITPHLTRQMQERMAARR